MKKAVIILIFTLVIVSAFAARKALVIGNATYADKPLQNPVNDANDVASALQNVGFTVSKHTNLNKEGFDSAIGSFTKTLAPNDEVVVYYSGHGVQIEGVNYLIPVRESIDSVARCKYLAYNGNMLVDELKVAALSIIILDACRDNPFARTRSLNKGLASMQANPGSQYIIFATAEGNTADDGAGRNSPFAESLIQNIRNSSKKITDLMQDVTNEVAAKTHERQIPWTAGNLRRDFYFRTPSSTASQPQEKKTAQPAIQVESTILTGTLEVESNTAGELYLDGNYVCTIAKSEIKTLRNVPVGSHELELRYSGKSNNQFVSIQKEQTTRHNFAISTVPANMIFVEGGTFQMGSNDGESDEKPVHQVTVSSFFIGKYEVTQKEWQEVMGSNPSYFKGDNFPVDEVSWYDALVYCNKRSVKEGLTPCYSISGSSDPNRWGSVPTSDNSTWNSVTCNWSANGYRLPTEAEWEYTARGGNKSKGYKYSGSNDPGSVAWYADNSGSKTHSVGGKQANELGIYDMSGNVWEWCWDWHDSSYYSKSESRDPRGSGSGSYRSLRGGSWRGNSVSCRVSYRGYGNPHNRGYGVGVRVLRANL